MITEIESKQMKKSLRTKGHKFVGVLFTAMGIFWLAHNVGWIPTSEGKSAILWPLLTIGLGLFVLFGSKHRHIRNND